MTTVKSRYFLYIALAFAFAFALSLPAFAFDHGCGGPCNGPNGPHFGGDGDVYVKNSNSATVNNNVKSEAETGENDADGGDGYNGGDGGDASGKGNNTGGNGGNGGDGGEGGLIITGNATSVVTIENHVNKNKTKVDLCGCEDDGHQLSYPWFLPLKKGDVKVKTRNNATVNNNVESEAETGDNNADGGDADEGGEGGDATGSEGSYNPFWGWGYYVPYHSGTNTGGDGGNGGDGGDAGEVLTGEAWSDVYVVNKVNRNVTRVRR